MLYGEKFALFRAAGIEEYKSRTEPTFQSGGIYTTDMPVKGPLGQFFNYKGMIGRVGIQDQDPKGLVSRYLQMIESGFLNR